MKKTLLLLVLCTLVGNTLRAATLQRAILSHQGKLTQFDQNHWLEAVEQAVAGDTIFFTSGVFYGDVTITKAITLIGAGIGAEDAFYKDSEMANAYTGCATTGETTTISGDINIAIPGDITLSKTLLENLRVINADLGHGKTISFTEPVTNPIIKRCQIDGWYHDSLNASATVNNLLLINCYMVFANLGNFVKASVINCYLKNVEDAPEGTEFTNSVLGVAPSCVNCQFDNCILGLPNGVSNTCINCIYGETGDHATFVNCWQVNNGHCFTRAQLQEGGYIGTDGTVVGPLGGSAPFTLIPAQPYVSSSTLNYDKSTKKLTVSATVNKGK